MEETEIIIEYKQSNENDPLSTNSSNDLSYDQHNPNIETEAEFYHQRLLNGRLCCKLCDQDYSSLQTLHIHIKKKHPDEMNHVRNIALKRQRQRKHKCNICQIYLKSVGDLNLHMDSIHISNKRDFSCVSCKASFSDKNELKDHMNIKHNINAFIFKCKTCGYWTIKKSHYKQHLKIHENEKQFQCPQCDYTTSYLSNFNSHCQIHSNVKPYNCEHKDCNYKSSSKSSLWIHKFQHNPEKYMLLCDKCNYKTVYRQSLKKHLQRHDRKLLKMKTNLLKMKNVTTRL